MQQDVLVIIGELNDDGGCKIQGQVAEQGLLLFERKLTQCLGCLNHIGSPQQSHSLVPTGSRNRVPKLIGNWRTHRKLDPETNYNQSRGIG